MVNSNGDHSNSGIATTIVDVHDVVFVIITVVSTTMVAVAAAVATTVPGTTLGTYQHRHDMPLANRMHAGTCMSVYARRS